MFLKKEYSAVATTPTNIQKSGQTANGDLGHTVWHLVITFLLIRVTTWRVMCLLASFRQSILWRELLHPYS